MRTLFLAWLGDRLVDLTAWCERQMIGQDLCRRYRDKTVTVQELWNRMAELHQDLGIGRSDAPVLQQLQKMCRQVAEIEDARNIEYALQHRKIQVGHEILDLVGYHGYPSMQFVSRDSGGHARLHRVEDAIVL